MWLPPGPWHRSQPIPASAASGPTPVSGGGSRKSRDWVTWQYRQRTTPSRTPIGWPRMFSTESESATSPEVRPQPDPSGGVVRRQPQGAVGLLVVAADHRHVPLAHPEGILDDRLEDAVAGLGLDLDPVFVALEGVSDLGVVGVGQRTVGKRQLEKLAHRDGRSGVPGRSCARLSSRWHGAQRAAPTYGLGSGIKRILGPIGASQRSGRRRPRRSGLPAGRPGSGASCASRSTSTPVRPSGQDCLERPLAPRPAAQAGAGCARAACDSGPRRRERLCAVGSSSRPCSNRVDGALGISSMRLDLAEQEQTARFPAGLAAPAAGPPRPPRPAAATATESRAR